MINLDTLRYIYVILIEWVIQKFFVYLFITRRFYYYHTTGKQPLTITDWNKLNHYYALGTALVFGKGFSILTGTPFSLKKRLEYTYLGSCIGLIDDLLDVYQYSSDEIYKLVIAHKPVRNTQFEALLLRLLKLIQAHHPNPLLLTELAQKILEAQTQSELQKTTSATVSEIEKFTRDKGGYSIILMYSFIENPISETKEQALMELGYLMQLGNDLFDIHKDILCGIRTICNEQQDLQLLEQTFIRTLNTAYNAFINAGWPKQKLIKFWSFIGLLYARVFVCLEHYKHITATKGLKQFSAQNHTRSELICDMDTFKNLSISISFYNQHIRSKWA